VDNLLDLSYSNSTIFVVSDQGRVEACLAGAFSACSCVEVFYNSIQQSAVLKHRSFEMQLPNSLKVVTVLFYRYRRERERR